MSKIKVGDQVKFIDQEGGGTVSQILERNRILVLIPEGFEIPVGIHEVIPMNPELKNTDPFHQEFKTEETKATSPSFEDKKPDFKHFHKKNSLFLAFFPVSSDLISSSEFELYFINASDHHVIYSLSLEAERNEYLGMDFGSVEPFQAELISEIPESELHMWKKGVIQVLFQADEMKQVPSPLNHPFRFKQNLFRHKENLEFIIPFQKDAILYEVGSLYQQKIVPDRKKENINERVDFLKPYLQKDKTALVDLHIEKITNDHKSLRPLEILQRQISLLKKILDHAIRADLNKVVVIHGVGKGILKAEIEKIVKENKGMQMMDAPINIFGVGASEILLWHDN